MRIAAIGRTRILLQAIEEAARRGHDVPLVVTCRPAPEYGVGIDEFAATAKGHGAQFLSTQHINEPGTLHVLREARADVAISVNWIGLIGEGACGAFSAGILNLHAGDLPRYRGNAPIAWAILNDETRIGLTVHQMEPEKLDAGAIVLKEYIDGARGSYCGELHAEFERRGPALLVRAAEGLVDGSLVPVPQDANPSSWLRCFPRRPEDGRIVWAEPGERLARLVRASAEPFAGAFARFTGDQVVIWRARFENWPSPSMAVPGQVVSIDARTGEVGVATGSGILILEEVETGNRERGAANQLVRSLRDRFSDGAGAAG